MLLLLLIIQWNSYWWEKQLLPHLTAQVIWLIVDAKTYILIRSGVKCWWYLLKTSTFATTATFLRIFLVIDTTSARITHLHNALSMCSRLSSPYPRRTSHVQKCTSNWPYPPLHRLSIHYWGCLWQTRITEKGNSLYEQEWSKFPSSFIYLRWQPYRR